MGYSIAQLHFYCLAVSAWVLYIIGVKQSLNDKHGLRFNRSYEHFMT